MYQYTKCIEVKIMQKLGINDHFIFYFPFSKVSVGEVFVEVFHFL